MASWNASTATAPAVYASTEIGDVGRNPAQGFLVPVGVTGANNLQAAPKPAIIPETWGGQAVEQSTALFDWFEDFHVIPREFDLGNVLSDQTYAVEVFSAFRRLTREWLSFTNNAGMGVDLVGEPTLPASTPPLSGYVMTLEVLAIGPPFVDSTIDFEFDSGTAEVPITLQRIVLFAAQRPVFPLRERLAFLTNILRRAHGTEQRVRLRKSPRKSLLYNYLAQSISDRQRMENLLFDWQARTFGVPLWFDETVLTLAATAGDTVLTVEETDYRDIRVGGLVAVFTDPDTFDVVEVASFTSTTITLTSALLESYAVGASVLPLATCRASSAIRGERFAVNGAALQVEFSCTENDIDLSDVSAFESHDGKVLILDNSMQGPTSGEEFEVPFVTIDSETGLDEVMGAWDSHRRSAPLIIRATGRAGAWALRRLAYALGGRQVSFYIARAIEDLEPVANLASGAATINVANYGYAQFVRHRQPKNLIRVTFVDGSTPLFREVTDSASVSSTVDQLTLDTTWPATYTPAEVARIEFVELVRLDSDDVEIEYDEGGHVARIISATKTLLP